MDQWIGSGFLIDLKQFCILFRVPNSFSINAFWQAVCEINKFSFYYLIVFL